MAGAGSTPDGGALAERLVFSHANGFPAATYARMLAPLRRGFEVSHVDVFGHDPRYPVARGWHGLSRQLQDHLEVRRDGGAVWLVGHSLGGYLSLLAAAQPGAQVAGVVLLDSPLIGGMTGHLLRWSRRTGLDRHLLPLQQTLQRRARWPDVDAVRAHFAAKPAFARWDPRVLDDYAWSATVPDADGRRLLFDREVECSIYRTLPTRTVCRAARRISAPVAFIGGRNSREVRQIGLGATRTLVGARVAWLDGSHLFPMERPEAAAAAVGAAIDAMRAVAPRDARAA